MIRCSHGIMVDAPRGGHLRALRLYTLGNKPNTCRVVVPGMRLSTSPDAAARIHKAYLVPHAHDTKSLEMFRPSLCWSVFCA